ncbi:MAG TPA: hypothetical protein VIJ71_10630 [Mycobacteriales bacterium]
MTTDLGEYGSGEKPVLAPMEPPRRASRLTRRQLVAIPLVLLLVEGVVLGERIHAQRSRDADPVRVASAFFAAVASDDAATAAALTRFPAGVDTRFTSADLRAQGGIIRSTVTRSARDGDRATISVKYVLAGLDAHSDLLLARSYQGFLHAPTWRIVGGLPVLHIRAAPFEPEATVDGRELLLKRGTADVTVLPGLVTITLQAIASAAPAATTIAADAEGRVVSLPATLDPALAAELENMIGVAVDSKYPGTDVGGTDYFDVGFQIGDDGTVTFHGQVPVGARSDNATGMEVIGGRVSVSGTATYGGGGLSLIHIQIG